MKCPNCGTDNPANEDFCNNCGAYLHEPIATDATVIGTGQPHIATSHGDDRTVRDQIDDSSLSTTTTSTLVPNTNLQAGRYIVERILGQGGMGAAVLARDTRVSNKLVVIKELISDETDQAQRQEDVRNFTREVETLARLDHPLIPAVTDSFQEGSRYFMVQDYVAGENLEDYMERVKKPMPEQEALTYTSQVLDILQHLAQQQPPIVHRDIKPANIIISTRDKLAHLVDFGIARTDETKPSKRKQTSALGTPGYAPPEQYQGNADARSDLYALAATLHFLLTNRDPRDYPPFNYPRVRTLNSQLSPDTERMLERALMLDITKRYQNAVAMKHDIDEILLHDFRTSSDGSIYLRGTSGTLAASPSATRPASPPQPQTSRPGRAEPISPMPPSYEAGLRPLPRSESAPPRPPTYPRSWLDEPSHDSYEQQQVQQPRGRQQQMFMPPPPIQRQPQSQDNRFILLSFVFLLIVFALITAIFFVLPYLGL